MACKNFGVKNFWRKKKHFYDILFQLPHGWPSLTSWLDEAFFAKHTIKNATDVSIDVLNQIDIYIKQVENEMAELIANLSK